MADYIDMEAFKKSVEELYCKPCKAEGKDHNGCWCRACWVDDMLDEVECFSPSDVAPVVHGRWLTWEEMFPGKTPKKKNNLGVFCSSCKNHADNMFDFCPHCGARMDGDAERSDT